LIKKTVRYIDFNDEWVKEDLYFHLSKPEIIELEVSVPQGFEAWVTEITEKEDKAELFRMFTMFIRKGYGVRSLDGKRFTKNPQLVEEFLSSNAYEALFMDVLTDTDKLVEFFQGILPKGLDEDVKKLIAADPKVTSLTAVEDKNEPTVITAAELRDMTEEDRQVALEKIKKGEATIAV
jgi:hypothetical protein